MSLTISIDAPPPAEPAAIECVLFDPGGLKEFASARADANVAAAGWQDVHLTLTAARGAYVVRCGVHLRETSRLAGVYGDAEVK